jgi:hypothetical protein
MALLFTLLSIAFVSFLVFIFLMVTGLLHHNKTRILLSTVALIFTIVLTSWSAYLFLTGSYAQMFKISDEQIFTESYAPVMTRK